MKGVVGTLVLLCGIAVALALHCGCDRAQKARRAERNQESSSALVRITVGLYIDHDLAANELGFDGDEPLEYYLNGRYLGAGDDGARKLLTELKGIERDTRVELLNPYGGYIIGRVSRRPDERDGEYKYPLVRNIDIRAAVKAELDRIRGWSDGREPIEPWQWRR